MEGLGTGRRSQPSQPRRRSGMILERSGFLACPFHGFGPGQKSAQRQDRLRVLGAAESSKRGRFYTLSATAFKKRRKTVKQLAIQFLRYIYDKCGVSRG